MGMHYGNMGCGVLIRNIFTENQHTQRKLLNFENWVNGEVSKLIFFNEK